MDDTKTTKDTKDTKTTKDTKDTKDTKTCSKCREGFICEPCQIYTFVTGVAEATPDKLSTPYNTHPEIWIAQYMGVYARMMDERLKKSPDDKRPVDATYSEKGMPYVKVIPVTSRKDVDSSDYGLCVGTIFLQFKDITDAGSLMTGAYCVQPPQDGFNNPILCVKFELTIDQAIAAIPDTSNK